jgi:hypothetical protein
LRAAVCAWQQGKYSNESNRAIEQLGNWAIGEPLLSVGVFHSEEGNVCFIKKYKYKTYSKGLSIYTIIKIYLF